LKNADSPKRIRGTGYAAMKKGRRNPAQPEAADFLRCQGPLPAPKRGKGEMPYLKGNLHTHTSFSDGANLPEEILAVYADLGFDFVAITDHDYLIRPHYWESLPEKKGDLLVFKGIELEYAPLNYRHIGKVLGDAETLLILNHPQQYRLSVAEVNRQIAMISRNMPIHGIEVTDKGVYTPLYDTPEIPLPKIASDDAHFSRQCGKAWIEVQSRRERDEILRTIKAGNFRMGFK
jgi:hypothetical protein